MIDQRTKHERSRAWDDRALPRWAWPAKAALRVFSSVRLGIVLIVCIAVYAAAGSTPLDLVPGTGLARGTMLWMLPALEMTQGEFYAAWPMRLLLMALVVNMVIATLRRIEMRLENLGVLAVHAGIVLIAAGSTIYAANRREAVLVLPVSRDGASEVANAWDAWRTELVIHEATGERRIALPGLPRYNDYSAGSSDRVLALRAGDAATIDGFAAYADSEEVATEVPSGGEPAWAVRVRATGQAMIDTGSVIVGATDDGRSPMTIAGIAEVRSGPPRVDEAHDVPQVFIERSRATIEVGGRRTRIDPIEAGGVVRLAPGVELIFERFIPTVRFERIPGIVEPADRSRELVGTYRHALIRVRLDAEPAESVWVPLSLDADRPTRIGRSLVSWRPVAMPLASCRLALREFTPVVHPGESVEGARDFRAVVQAANESGPTMTKTIALNRPLSLPLRGGILPSRMSIVHASWDREGWERDGTEGVRFAIFGVSVVRGAELIAAGAACMAMGTPWAFYIKPWLVRRRARSAREVAV